MSPGESLTIRARREGHLPSLAHLIPDPYVEFLASLRLVTPTQLAAIAETGGVELEPGRRTTLHDVGGAWFFNVAPGSLTVSATANGRTCREEYRAKAPADVAELVVDADSVSIAAFRCD